MLYWRIFRSKLSSSGGGGFAGGGGDCAGGGGGGDCGGGGEDGGETGLFVQHGPYQVLFLGLCLDVLSVEHLI